MATFFYPTNMTSYASPMHDSAKRRHTRFPELHVLPSGQNTPLSHAAMVVFDEASGSKGADDDKDDESVVSAHLPSIARMIETMEMKEKEALERSRVDDAGEQAKSHEWEHRNSGLWQRGRGRRYLHCQKIACSMAHMVLRGMGGRQSSLAAEKEHAQSEDGR
jgi:hypothetical protein